MVEHSLDDKRNRLLHPCIDDFDRNDRLDSNEVGLADVYHGYGCHNLLDRQHGVFLGNLSLDE